MTNKNLIPKISKAHVPCFSCWHHCCGLGCGLVFGVGWQNSVPSDVSLPNFSKLPGLFHKRPRPPRCFAQAVLHPAEMTHKLTKHIYIHTYYIYIYVSNIKQCYTYRCRSHCVITQVLQKDRKPWRAYRFCLCAVDMTPFRASGFGWLVLHLSTLGCWEPIQVEPVEPTPAVLLQA